MTAYSLRKLDLVLGCFHSALPKTEDQTARYIAALRNPDIFRGTPWAPSCSISNYGI
jgi:hypothetical protein